VTHSKLDLDELAKRLDGQAEALSAAAVKARANANADATVHSPDDVLDPLFAQKLELSLAPARQRLQAIAKRSE
jgi:hypothetical protein